MPTVSYYLLPRFDINDFPPVMCGKWETYPREFAKCRRCRKAKYCGKECQSTAWSEGHRFWCSAKDVDEDTTGDHSTTQGNQSVDHATVHIAVEGSGQVDIQVTNGTPRTERRPQRERGQDPPTRRSSPPSSGNPVVHPTTFISPSTTITPAIAAARAESSMSRERTLQPTAPHVRPRPTLRPTSAQNQQDPMNSSYLSFHIQSAGAAGASHDTAGRRRAETITGSVPTMSATAAGSNPRQQPIEVPPNVIPQRPGLHIQPGYVQTVVQAMSPTSTTASPACDWPMSSPVPSTASLRTEAGPSSRRPRMSTPRSPMEEDDMVLG